MRGWIAALVLIAAAASAGVAQDLAGSRARLVAAKREAAVAAQRAAALTQAAAGERGAANRAAAEERSLAARVAATAADLKAGEARVTLVGLLLARQRERLAAEAVPATRLTGALAAMARRPAVATLAQPGSLVDLIHVRAVLARTVPVVRRRTEGLRVELARTRALQAAAATAAAGLRDGRARLETDRMALAKAEANHRALATTLGRSAIGEQDRALALGERARDLADEMGESGRQVATAADLADLPGPLPRPLTPGALPPPLPHGAWRLPVAGKLVTGFGEVSSAGVRSRGLTFAVAAHAPVVAPAAGTVRYARRFRGYGTIVLIDHGAGWSSLLTGLAATPLSVGQAVAAGAPIGDAPGVEEARVTVELRRRGEPIDAAALVG